MRQVLFLCTHNSGRSQMAEALFNHIAPQGLTAASAGTEPGHCLNPAAVETMKEIGIDLPALGSRPKSISPEVVAESERIITMGCGVDQSSCPAALYEVEDWGLDDPHGQPIEIVRAIRDQIAARVEALVIEMTQETATNG